MLQIRFLFLFLFSILTTFAQQSAEKYLSTIRAEDLEAHLRVIAADSMEGRDTGSEGQKKAAKYIVNYLNSIGLQPASKDSLGIPSFYQPIKMYRSGWKDQYVKVNGKQIAVYNDFFPVGMINVPEEHEIDIVFVGYGIESKDMDNYASLDVKNKAVVYLEGTPPIRNIEKFMGKDGSDAKHKLAISKGAFCTFEISLKPSEEFKSLTAERRAVLSRYNLTTLDQGAGFTKTKDPRFVVSRELGRELMGVSKKAFKKILQGNYSKKINARISIKSERGYDLLNTANIAGIVEGTDKKDEYVVVSAHYDHVGVNSKGEIHNGADDDGSGTCALMEMAEALMKAKKDGNGPRRSVLFLWVTGEEKGLLGSQYYTDASPLVPLSKTVCDLNVDMIGRMDKEHEPNPNYVYLIGSDKLSSELHKISEEANKKTINFELDYKYNNPLDINRFYYRSDHYNFAKNRIPVIFYFSGVHKDYHKPTDDVDLIMFPKYTKITQLIFQTLWDLANVENRIKVDSNKK
ncbi:MAG: M28 family peptidase [Leadbetterella sp.]